MFADMQEFIDFGEIGVFTDGGDILRCFVEERDYPGKGRGNLGSGLGKREGLPGRKVVE